MEQLLAWIVLPALAATTALGVGLLVERLVAARTPRGLVLPLGFAASVVLLAVPYSLGLGARWAMVLLVLTTVVGLVVERGADPRGPAGPARSAGGTRRLRRVPRARRAVRRRDVRRLHVPGRHVRALRADRLHHGARHRHRGPRAVELPARHADAAGERISARSALRAGHLAPGARHRRGPRVSAVHRAQHRARGSAGRTAAGGSRDPETARVRRRRRGAGRLPALLVRAPGRDQGDGHDLLHPPGGRTGGGGGQGR